MKMVFDNKRYFLSNFTNNFLLKTKKTKPEDSNLYISMHTYSLFIGKSFLKAIASRNVKVAQLTNIIEQI